ncbi:hypothetical protein [Gordonia sp. DT101]|uniref:rhamnosyltransferase WsaF family glycosyltransferase n=1 Tax=Gordonia sp. DT101 TaxID=3416545 RepID=UPI003CF7CF2A
MWPAVSSNRWSPPPHRHTAGRRQNESSMNRHLPVPSDVGRRIRQARNLWQAGGVRSLTQRAARRLYEATDARELDAPINWSEIVDPPKRMSVPEQRPAAGTHLTIGWISSPPSAGSGGHTTMFRMVEALERAGHQCILYLHEEHGSPISFHEQTIRTSWPRVKATVSHTGADMSKCDAIVATTWQCAYVLASRTQSTPTRRLYFIQDFEPFFEPRGSAYALAEMTYGFGFRNVALGAMVGDLIAGFGPYTQIEFGCDTNTYELTEVANRSGVVCYSRPKTARRGTQLAILALQEFHRRMPDEPIHIFGDPIADLPFPAVHHGKLAPKDLARLYNECVAGLGLSFTNISLVVEEMLACGTIPIVNDSTYARADMPSPYVKWARPTPAALGAALAETVRTFDPYIAKRAATSVRSGNWEDAQQAFVNIVESEIYGSNQQEAR